MKHTFCSLISVIFRVLLIYSLPAFSSWLSAQILCLADYGWMLRSIPLLLSVFSDSFLSRFFTKNPLSPNVRYLDRTPRNRRSLTTILHVLFLFMNCFSITCSKIVFRFNFSFVISIVFVIAFSLLFRTFSFGYFRALSISHFEFKQKIR